MDKTEEWYRRYGEAVYRRGVRLLNDEPQAWDVTQEVFLRAHRGASMFRREGAVLSWLLTICDHACFSLLRTGKVRARIQARPELAGLDLGTDDGLERALVTSDLVGRVLAHFPPDVQQIVVLRYVDELEQEQIASRLSVSRKTIYRKLQDFHVRCRALLTALDANGQQRGALA